MNRKLYRLIDNFRGHCIYDWIEEDRPVAVFRELEHAKIMCKLLNKEVYIVNEEPIEPFGKTDERG